MLVEPGIFAKGSWEGPRAARDYRAHRRAVRAVSTEAQHRVGRAFTRSVELRQGERVLRTSTVSRERLFMAVLGVLYLTNERLIFCPYLYTLSWSPVVLDIGGIDAIGETTIPWYRNLAHLFVSAAWYVKVDKRRYFFASLNENDKDGWFRAISSVTNVLMGQPHGP